MRLHTTIAALIVVGIGLGLVAPAHVSRAERVLTVCYWGCDFRRIQDAIDAAFFGDETILIKSPGLYEEKLTITKSIKLVGDENALPIVLLFMEAFSGPLISIGEEEKPIKVTLKNLSLLGWPEQAGIVVKGPTILMLENVEVRRYRPGIGIITYDERAQITIKNSIFRENGESAISSSSQIVVEDSQIFENGGGISIYEKGQLHLIRSSVFNNMTSGVSLNNSSKGLIEDSHIYGNRTVGVGLGDSSSVELLRTAISQNGTHGIILGEQPKLVARESFIYQNDGWGLTAVLRKCGFNQDLYKGGTVDVDESNVIIQNRKGDICLP